MPEPSTRASFHTPPHTPVRPIISYGAVVFILAIVTFVLWNIGWAFNLVNMAMIYLLPVLFSAVRFGRGPAFLAAGLGVLLFDFFFVPPLLSFTVSDLRYLISFAVFLLVAGLTATQASRLRRQVQEAEEREAKTASLYAISQSIVAVSDVREILRLIVHHISATLHVQAAVLLPDHEGHLKIVQKTEGTWVPGLDLSLSDLVYKTSLAAGRNTEYFADSDHVYVPLQADARTLGVLCVQTGTSSPAAKTDHQAFIEALAGLASVCVARANLEEEAKAAQLSVESERLRTALLNSISHELRTPLATIIGSATGILEGVDVLTKDDQASLLYTIRDGALRMNRLVTNLLGMVRLESGMLQLKRAWCDVADIIGVSLTPFEESLRLRPCTVFIPPEVPGVFVDDVLIEQVVINVLSNAIKYSPETSPIAIEVQYDVSTVAISIRDYGIGIRGEELPKIFDKFYRSERTSHIPGTGLGLAICKGIMLAHAGDIEARNAYPGTEIIVKVPRDFPDNGGSVLD